MKKRLRKKMLLGEFQYSKGFSILAPTTKENWNDQLNQLYNIAKENDLLFIGYGYDEHGLSNHKILGNPMPAHTFFFLNSMLFQKTKFKNIVYVYFASPILSHIRQKVLTETMYAISRVNPDAELISAYPLRQTVHSDFSIYCNKQIRRWRREHTFGSIQDTLP